MKIRVASDLHTEFFNVGEVNIIVNMALPHLDEDKDTSLVLAGDIGSMKEPDCLVRFFDTVIPRFKEVFYIPGNHEYYGGDLDKTDDKISDLLDHHEDKLFFSSKGTSYEAGRPTINQCTLWTDYDGQNEESMLEAKNGMNDYRLISRGKRTAIPEDMLEKHINMLNDLEVHVNEGDIVITHHLPSFQSVPEAYKHERVNGAYATNLEEFILRKKPSLWIHGHTHDAFDYMIGNTRILCNPRGYGTQYKKNGYNPKLVVEI